MDDSRCSLKPLRTDKYKDVQAALEEALCGTLNKYGFFFPYGKNPSSAAWLRKTSSSLPIGLPIGDQATCTTDMHKHNACASPQLTIFFYIRNQDLTGSLLCKARYKRTVERCKRLMPREISNRTCIQETKMTPTNEGLRPSCTNEVTEQRTTSWTTGN